MKSFYILSLVTLSICVTSCKITAIEPSVSYKASQYFPAEPSEINVVLDADLTHYIHQADNSFPFRFSGGDDPCEGLRYSYEVTRNTIDFEGSGNEISLGLKIKINSLKATYCKKCGRILGRGDLRCFFPKISGSCGMGDGDPGFDILYKSKIDFTPNYKVKTLTSLQTFNTSGSCPASILRINALPTLKDKLTGTMIDMGKKVDEYISTIDYLSSANETWKILNKEISIENIGFIKVNPKQLRLSNIETDNTRLRVTLGLTCLPVVSQVSTPYADTKLPDLTTCKMGDNFNIITDLYLDYKTLSSSLNRIVEGKEIFVGSKKFKFTKAEIYGYGNNKIIVMLSFKGTRKGTIYFTGSPTFDTVSHKIVVNDLDFDIKTNSLLLRTAAWMLNSRITNQLRNGVQYDLSDLLIRAQSSIELGLSKKISPKVTSKCHVNEINILGLFPTSENLLIRSKIQGGLSLQIR
ncbi:DUF4403 family protein [Pedobacter sp. ASV28]|uniref:DUF4403 family protein n=1 Tax=Pedobacter sp. ASV28 TaxID=2795123 RepID=UPI0018EBB67E|nr:DUF4403 family protein [Pedobacter sp. ASV28]